MAGSIYELFILLQLKDLASGGLGRVEDRLRAAGKEGRATLQTFQDLRTSLKKDLTIAGVGVGVLTMLKKGVEVAGNFESAMADMRMSVEELGADGTVNIRKLTEEYNELESLGIRIGNRLPGTTQDFIEMFSVLKQGGLQAKTIIDGAGESVANLAVVTHEIPKDLAEPFAQYAQQFQLTGDEAIKLSDTLARIRFATGLRPAELIEGSKFFQLRAGVSFGFKGLSGAEISGRLLATLRTFGLEGGIGGRELGGFMLGLKFHTKDQMKALDELHRKGIDLQFFNKKGEFQGVDNVFAQMEKLRRLSTEERIGFGERLFSRENIGIMNTFMQAGVEGWHKINQRIDKVPPLQELINQKTETYNAKLEAVKGTLTNLEATAFLPMLNTLKPMLDVSNEIVGSLQEWAKLHPEIAKTGTEFVGVTSAALALTFTIKSGITMWGLYRLASTTALKSTQVEIIQMGVVADVATVKAGRLNAMLAGLGRMGALKITVALAAAGATYELLMWLKDQSDKYQAELARRQEQVSATREDALSKGQVFGSRSREKEARYEVEQAEFRLGGLKPGTKQYDLAAMQVRGLRESYEQQRAARETQERLAKESWEHLSMLLPLVGRGAGIPFPWEEPGTGEKRFEEPIAHDRRRLLEQVRAETALHDPNVLAKLIRQAQRGELAKGGVKTGEEVERFLGILREAIGAEKFKQAQEIAAADLIALSQSTQNATTSIRDWFGMTEKMPTAFSRVADAASRFSFRMNNIAPPTFNFGGAPPVPFTTRPRFQIGPAQPPFRFGPTSFQSEPRVQVSDALARSVSEARAGSRGASASRTGKTVHIGSINVNVPEGSTAANDPAELARLLAYEIELQSERA